MGELDWALINSRLPYARNKEQLQERKKMWKAIDVNDNGFASLAEITRVWCIIGATYYLYLNVML